jgi:hypothetical protein
MENNVFTKFIRDKNMSQVAETITFSDEEISKIKQLQGDYLMMTNELGQVELERTVLIDRLTAMDEAKKTVLNKFVEIRNSEQELVKELNEKYGDGMLDLQTGTFTPSPKTENTEVVN